MLPLLGGCGETASVGTGEPVTVRAVPKAPLVAYLTSFKSGVGAVAALDGSEVVELFPTSGDALLRRARAAGTFFVLDRRNGAIYRHALASTRLERALYRDRGANFQDVHELADGSLWVSALNRESIVRLDPSGSVLDTVSLKALAAPEAKGFAYPTFFWSSAGRTFLLVQRLKNGVRPSEVSYVVELAAGKGLVGEPRELAATNPYTDWVPAKAGCAYVGEAGEVGMYSQLDGAIERFCPGDAQPWNVVATERALQRDIYDFVALSERELLCLSTAPKNEIFVFDLERQVGQSPIASAAGFRYVDLETAGPGRAYVADRDEKNPGLRLVDAARGTLGAPFRTVLEPLSLLRMR